MIPWGRIEDVADAITVAVVVVVVVVIVVVIVVVVVVIVVVVVTLSSTSQRGSRQFLAKSTPFLLSDTFSFPGSNSFKTFTD